MRVSSFGVIGAIVLLAALPGIAVAQPSPAPVKPPAHHHHRHRTRHIHVPPTPAPPPAAPETDAAGTTPAPVPNEDIGPPNTQSSASPSLDPGSLHLHYPPLGDGYLPGSSPQDMANTQTPKVPGAVYTVPLQQGVPQTLPPPQSQPLGADH